MLRVYHSLYSEEQKPLMSCVQDDEDVQEEEIKEPSSENQTHPIHCHGPANIATPTDANGPATIATPTDANRPATIATPHRCQWTCHLHTHKTQQLSYHLPPPPQQQLMNNVVVMQQVNACHIFHSSKLTEHQLHCKTIN